LPEDGFYEFDGYGSGHRAIILGRAQPALGGYGPPRPFYATASAARLTQAHRSQQVNKFHEQEEANRLAQRQRQLDFQNSEIGQLRQRLQVLERLEKDGRLPPELPPAEPAVRQGK